MQQSHLDKFFKVKNCNFKNLCNKTVVTKKKLKPRKTPMKSPISTLKDCKEPEVINLISDDESNDEKLNCCTTSNMSNSSALTDSTLIYSAEKKSSPETATFSTPSSKKKFYSPTKKRRLSIKSPIKAKRNLYLSLDTEDVKDEKFMEVTNGLDDYTIFLMRIIYECLNDRNLCALLNETSLNLFEKIIQADPPAKRMVCRLYWQKEQWCRWKKIRDNACGNRTDIDEPIVHAALNYLCESGFISVAQHNGDKHNLDFDELASIMYEKEVKDICKLFKIKAKTKEMAIQLLKDFMRKRTNITNYLQGDKSNNESRLLKVMGAKAGVCYKLTDLARKSLKELHILMYLGMDYSIIRDSKLELMLLNEKNMIETYPIEKNMLDNASVVFRNKSEFERYLTAHAIHEEFLAKTESTERCRLIESVFDIYKNIPKEEMLSYATLPVWLRRFTPPHIYVKILEEGVIDLKRDRSNANLVFDILSALIDQNIFRQHRKANWFAEKALVLDKFLGDPDEAAKVLIQGFQSNLPTEDKQLLFPRALLLAKRKTNKIDDASAFLMTMYARNSASWEKQIKAEHLHRVPTDNFGKGKIKFPAFVDGTRTLLSAEETCINYFVDESQTYTHGGHWEGRIVNTIFFLLFWDVIYAPLRGLQGLFLSRFQLFPLDLFTDAFHANRQLLLQQRLRDIEEGTEADMLKRMHDTWHSRPESEVSWGVHRDIGWEDVSAVCVCLGTRRVSAVCRRLATDYQYAHSGFPDLTLWNTRTKQITFVEVKTDSDKPSMKQKQWMHYLKDCKIDVMFCYIGVHTTRARARNCEDIEYFEYDDD